MNLNVLLVLLCVILGLCFILMLMNRSCWPIENFENPVAGGTTTSSLDEELLADVKNKSPEELKQYVSSLKQRLVNYGYMPDSNDFVKKTELSPDAGTCTVSKANDRDLYRMKTSEDIPGPRVNLDDYIKKSSLPPDKVCPTTAVVDMSKYVLKSTIPPPQSCPVCIAPKVKVSAGLCRDCPPCPACPAPEPCPVKECPAPPPCPVKECPKCSDVKYIKVPTIITRTVVVDKNNNVISTSDKKDTPTTTMPADDTFYTRPAEDNKGQDTTYDDYKVGSGTNASYITKNGSTSVGADMVSSAEGCLLCGTMNAGNPELNNDYKTSGGLSGLNNNWSSWLKSW
jgi:hypothetical protein